MMPRVYIIILNYKRWEDVAECLETVFRSQYSNFSVIVIDNDSRNNSLDHLVHWTENNTTFSNRLSHFTKNILRKPISYRYLKKPGCLAAIRPADAPRITFIQNNENLGFAAGINPVLKYLSNEDALIWLLNPDMVIEESTLAELVDFATENPVNAIIGSVIKYYSNPEQVHLYGGGRINFASGTISMIRDRKKIAQLDYISGGSLFTHASNFEKLGVLPEDYFLYWEETDWCYRAKLSGYKLYLCGDAICYDKVSSSIGKSFLADYYYTRNGLLFLSKYRKQHVKLALSLAFLRFLKKVATAQPARARGVYSGMVSFLKRARHEN